MEHLDKYIENTFKGHRSKLVDLSDGQLHTEGGFAFPIHRFALADKSQYFFALFCGIEKDKKEALILGVKGEVLSSILTYIYTGEIRVTTENICDLIIAADYLLLEDLLSEIETLLPEKLSIANSLAIFNAALKINSRDIFKESLRFVELHFEDIMRCRNKAFYELPLEALKQLLSDRSLRIRNENVIWDAIVEWISAYLPNSLPCVPDLLLCLASAEVNNSLAREILQHDFVARNTSCSRICGLKSTNPELSHLQILQHYVQDSPNPKSSLHLRRSPSYLKFVALHYRKNGEICTQIYVTYDEKLDFWRKVVEVDRKLDYFLAVNDCIYIGERFGRREKNPLLRFSITEKHWLQFRNFRNTRYNYKPLKLNGFIYILGGVSSLLCHVFDVEIYDPEDDTWHDTTPMPPVYNINAVTLNESIYVVGNRSLNRRITGHDEVIAFVYNPETEIWNVLPRPALNRSFCALAVYHEKLYLIGGSQLLEDDSYHRYKEVEVFDSSNNIWSRAADLPYAYTSPKAVVINDQMIVYEAKINPATRSLNPSVVWNVQNECWETVKGFFSNTDLHMYNFFTLEDAEYVDVIAKENKDPATVFEKSPIS